ncbi:MAG: C40 family peptidase [Deltaproteobacteria bacterium]|nr:C40 family peptidase [Deltaproteobacteria bacterium]
MSLFCAFVLFAAAPPEGWRGEALQVAGARVEDFEEVEEIASRYLGRTYSMGGVGEPDFDCSGFVCRVFAESGYALPRVSREQAQVGEVVELDRLGAGDLLFFASKGDRVDHVAIYLGDGQIIHAASGEGQVTTGPLSALRSTLVSARRVLGLDLPETEPKELEEHGGEFELPAPLRRSGARLRLESGPELLVSDRGTALRARMGAATEAGVLGPVIVPELSMYWPSLAIRAELAAVVRMDEGKARLTPIESPVDVLSFLRTVSIGLPGADLEARLSRLSDYSLGAGDLVDRVTPASSSSGVPGLSLERSPLSLLFAHRALGVEVFIDDVVAPGLMGAGYKHVMDGTRAGVLVVTDQRAALGEDRRAVNAGEVSVEQTLMSRQRTRLGASLSIDAVRALGVVGYGGSASLHGAHRSAKGIGGGLSVVGRALTGPIRGGQFGPTYVAHRGEELELTGSRFVVGGAAALDLAWLRFQASFEAPTVGNGTDLDQSLSALLELRHLGSSKGRGLDLRLAYSARAPFSERRLDVVHGLLRFAVSEGWSIDGWVERGRAVESGLALTVFWAP